MKRTLVLGSSLTTALLLAGALTNCAADETSDSSPNTGTVVPDASADVVAATDAGADSSDGQAMQPEGCDPGDPDCTTTVASCSDVDWCGVTTGVSSSYLVTTVWGAGANDLWIGGSGGTLVHFDGATWTPSTTNVTNTFNAIWGSSSNDVYAASSTDALLHTTGGATPTWTKLNLPVEKPTTSARITSIWGTSAEDVHLGGAPCVVVSPEGWWLGNANQFAKADVAQAPTGWSPTMGESTVMAMWGASADDVWVSVDNSQNYDTTWQLGQMFHGTRGDDGVLAFTEIDSLATGRLNAVLGTSANDLWAVGELGAIRRWKPSDTRFEIMDSGVGVSLNGIWASSPNDVWIVGDNATILHFDGTTLTRSTAQLPRGLKPDFRGIWGSGPNDIWIAGGSTVLHYTGPKTKNSGGS